MPRNIFCNTMGVADSQLTLIIPESCRWTLRRVNDTLAAMSEPQTVRRIKKTEFMGGGCLVQGLGLILLIPGLLMFLNSTVLSFAISDVSGDGSDTMKGVNVAMFFLSLLLSGAGGSLVLVGYRMATKLTCGHCGNVVVDSAKLCPTCHANLS